MVLITTFYYLCIYTHTHTLYKLLSRLLLPYDIPTTTMVMQSTIIRIMYTSTGYATVASTSVSMNELTAVRKNTIHNNIEYATRRVRNMYAELLHSHCKTQLYVIAFD